MEEDHKVEGPDHPTVRLQPPQEEGMTEETWPEWRRQRARVQKEHFRFNLRELEGRKVPSLEQEQGRRLQHLP